VSAIPTLGLISDCVCRIVDDALGRSGFEQGRVGGLRPSASADHWSDHALSAEAARQPSVDRRLGEVRRKKGERYRHADRALGFFSGAAIDSMVRDGSVVSRRASGERREAHRQEPRALGLASAAVQRIVRLSLDDLATSIRGWRRPRGQQDAIWRFSRNLLCKLNLQRSAPDRDAFDGAQVAAEIEDVGRRCA
jgi:hypothetical protein